MEEKRGTPSIAKIIIYLLQYSERSINLCTEEAWMASKILISLFGIKTVFVKSIEKETGSMSNDKEYEMDFLRFS